MGTCKLSRHGFRPQREMSTCGVDRPCSAPYSNEIWSVIPRLSAMRSNCSMVGLSLPQLILFRYCLVQPNLRANSASLMFLSANAFFKSIFVSFFISLWARYAQSKARKKDTPLISGSILSINTLYNISAGTLSIMRIPADIIDLEGWLTPCGV